MFNSSPLSKLIKSLEEWRASNKKNVQVHTKTFDRLKKWSCDENNTAIQDICSKISLLVSKFDHDFGKESQECIESMVKLFKEFKDQDVKAGRLHQYKRFLEYKENKYYANLQKFALTKFVKEFMHKHEAVKTERERTEFKLYEYLQDVDTTKSILFKKNMKSMTQYLKRQNEAERVLLDAMDSLLDQIPDITAEVVDDLAEIAYKNEKEADEICSMASKKLATLSTTSLRAAVSSVAQIEFIDENQQDPPEQSEEFLSNLERAVPMNTVENLVNLGYCPNWAYDTNPLNNPAASSSRPPNLYPCLNRIDEEEEVTVVSEMTSRDFFIINDHMVRPSAPSIDQLDSTGPKVN